MPLVGVNNHQPILHMSKKMVHCYYKYENIIQFEIGYMINPPHHFNKVFREQVKKVLSPTFYKRTMKIERRIYVLWN